MGSAPNWATVSVPFPRTPPEPLTPSGLLGDDANGVPVTDLMALFVACCVIDQAEVVFDAAGNGDEEQPGGLIGGSEPVRAAAGQEHEAASQGVEGVVTAPDGQFAAEHVEALVFPVMDVQRRPGPDPGLKDAQGSAGGALRRTFAPPGRGNTGGSSG